MIVCRLFATTVLSIAVAGLAAERERAYTPSNENFSNPERGFYIQSQVSQSSLAQARTSQGISLVRTYFRLDSYRDMPLPQSFLDKLANDLTTVRNAGAKIIPRFTYNYSKGGEDAPLSRIKGHIAQLRPILKANADIIAFLEAGFIGAWGEWHSSTNGLDNAGSRKDVLFDLLATLPKERAVVLRYNRHKREIFGGDQPLGPTEAFQGDYRSRTGAINDCLGASRDDWGTYSLSGSSSQTAAGIEKEKSFLNLDNRYVPQGGETCNPSPYSGCEAVLAKLKRMRWDVLNVGYHKQVLDDWKTGGCMEDVRRRLGYRFRMLRSTSQDSARPGGAWRMSFSMVNDGWGKAYNPRGLELVLRRNTGDIQYYLPLKEDPRRWLPEDTARVVVEAGLPASMPPGEYRVFLHLPDTAASLRNNPAYSIRLANQALWEESTGFNDMSFSLVVSSSAGGATYPGGQVLLPWGGKPNAAVNPKPERRIRKGISQGFDPGFAMGVDAMGRFHRGLRALSSTQER